MLKSVCAARRMTMAGKFALAVVVMSTIAGGPTAASPLEYSQGYKACIGQARDDSDHINSCRDAETVREDLEMKVLYGKLQTVLSKYRSGLLEKDQYDWVRFRDSECDFEGSEVIGGPLGIVAQAQVALRAECLLEQTHNRLVRLGNDYKAAIEDGRK